MIRAMRRRHGTLNLRLPLFFLLIGLTTASLASLPGRGQQAVPVPVGFVVAEGADFGALRRAGGTAVKLVADWSQLESGHGQFDWSSLDDAVGAATRAGLQVVLVLSYTPRWASLATGLELSDPEIYRRQPPKRIADWEAFVSAIVSRYKARVKDWQVWTTLSLPLYRGTIAEYLALLRAAHARAKAVDPSNRIVLATPYGIDLAWVRRALLEAPSAFEAVSLSPRGMPPDALLRPMGALRERLLARMPKRLWIEWDPRSSGDRPTWSGQLVKVMTIARIFSTDRLFWVGETTAATDAVLRSMADHVGTRAFAGYLVREHAIVYVFGDNAPVAVAWSETGEAPLPVGSGGIRVYAATGEMRQVADGGKAIVVVASEPAVITGIGADMVAEARHLLQTKGLPVPPSSRDFGQAVEVTARLGRTNLEQGLYNMPYRSRRNGAVKVVVVDGSEAVRTDAAGEVVFIYFDVDDSFLFFVDGRASVEVSVEVHGAAAPHQLGFNLFYDSMTGYRFTPWQWVDAKDGWVTYTFRLPDASFANTWGWDFAINAAGNQKEDLTVRKVTVRKAPLR